jgi:hypothetical protein
VVSTQSTTRYCIMVFFFFFFFEIKSFYSTKLLINMASPSKIKRVGCLVAEVVPIGKP